MKQDAKAARTRNQADRLRPVAGRHNQRLKELRLAFRRAELTPHGECAIEGVKLLEEALRSGQHLESVFFSESARPLAEKLLPQIGARTETLVLPNALFNSIVPSDAPQGVAALLKLPAFSSAHLLDRSSHGPLRRGRGPAGPRQSGHDPALRRSFWRGRNFSDRRDRQSLQLESPARFGGFDLPLAFLADRFGGTDPASARARRSPARNFLASGNSAAADLMDSAARHLHRQRRRRPLPRTHAPNGRNPGHPASRASRIAQRRSRC